MRLSTAAKDVMLEALDESQASGAKFGSLHATYSTNGIPELSGGTPPYARQAAVWATSSGGAKAGSTPMVFPVAASSTVRWVGWWTASTSGTFLGMTPNGGGVTQPFAVNAAGFASNTIDAPSHGYSNGNSVVFWAANAGEPLPGALVEGTVYYVIATGLTTDAFQVSATSGGSAVDIATVGVGAVQRIVEEVFGGQGTHTVTAYTLTLD